jgi:hypothetical protein
VKQAEFLQYPTAGRAQPLKKMAGNMLKERLEIEI